MALLVELLVQLIVDLIVDLRTKSTSSLTYIFKINFIK